MYSMFYNGQSVHAHLNDSFDGDEYELLCEIDSENLHETNFSEEYFENCLVPYLDDNGNPIPTSKCICGAHYPGECGCACDSWADNDWEE